MSDPVQLSHRLIRASAGTGKTFQLSNRYLGILAQETVPSEILATTFTKKAAGEILDRIMLRLSEAASSDGKLNELNEHLEGLKLSPEDCLKSLSTLVANLHRLQVKTLDSFFIKIAQCFSFELGFPPAWQIVDPLEDDRLREQAISSILSQKDVSDVINIMHLLHKGETVRSVHESMFDIVNLLYQLYLETDSSAWSSIQKLSSPKQEEIVQAIEFLEQYPSDKKSIRTAIEGDLFKFSQQDWKGFLKTGIASKVASKATKYRTFEIPDDMENAYNTLIQQAKSHSINQIIFQNEGAFHLLQHFDEVYRSLKQTARGYRFDDITQTLAKSSSKDDPQQMSFRLDANINHLLLDEFQDTSSQQWQVLRPIASRVTQPKVDRSYFCVGDMKQAIYGWRGGVAEIFDAVDQELPNLSPWKLTESFRSSQPVIDTVNQVFENLNNHPKLERATDGILHWGNFFSSHSTARKELPGHVTLETAWLDLEGKPSDDNVLKLTAQKVQEITLKNQDVSVGILVKTNAMVGRVIYHLRQFGISASEEGGNPLTDSAAVQLILSLLTWIDHPHDQISAFHVTNSPLGKGLGIDEQNHICVIDLLRRQLLVDGYGPVIEGLLEHLRPYCTEHELQRVEQLVQLAYAYQSRSTLRCSDFVTFIETEKVSQPASSQVRVMNVHQSKGLQFDVVILPELDKKLMGVTPEFVVERKDPLSPVTAISRYANQDIQALMPERFQKMFKDANRQQVVEQLCVMYVALTRAKNAMHLIIQPPRASEKTLPLTVAGLLRATLCDERSCGENELLFETGDPDWLEEQGSSEAKDSGPVTYQRKPIKLKSGGARNKGFNSLSPSSLEGTGTVSLQQLLQPTSNQQGMLYGTVMHTWLEQISWLEDDFPSDLTLRQICSKLSGGKIEYESTKQSLLKHLESSGAKELLSKELYAKSWDHLGEVSSLQFEVKNEERFSYLSGDTMMSGSIDRLVLVHEQDKIVAAEIIDYKTDRITDDSQLQTKVDYYQPQINAYRATVQQLYQLPESSVRCQLYFLNIDRAVQL